MLKRHYENLMTWIRKRDLPFLTGRLSGRRVSHVRYGRRVIRTTAEALLLMMLVCLGYGVCLYGALGLWKIYQATYIGQKYIHIYGQAPELIATLHALDIPSFALYATLLTFLISFAVGAICRLFEITPYLYMSRGIAGQLVFWGVPLGALSALLFLKGYELPSFATAFWLLLLPTLLQFRQCMRFACEVIPEIGDLLRAHHRLSRGWDYMRQVMLLVILASMALLASMVTVLTAGEVELATYAMDRFIPHSERWGLIPFDLNVGELIHLCIEVSITVLGVCLAAAAVSQVLGLVRIFYISKSMLWRVVLWGIPLLALCVHWIQRLNRIDPWESALALVLVPTICMFHGTIRLAYDLLPEANEILHVIDPQQIYWSRIKSAFQRLTQRLVSR